MGTRVFALPLIFGGLVAAATPAKVTFHEDVLPILQNRCQGCHRPGEAAPMALLTYEQARPWAKAIREAVLSKKMPPWHGDTPHGKFVNDRRLPESEIATLTAWADAGAPEGDRKKTLPALQFSEGWRIGTPEAIVEMPAEYTVAATGTIQYTWIVVPTGFTEDRWVEKLEVRPGSRNVVHHIVVMSRPPGSNYMKAAQSGIPFVPTRNPIKPGVDKGIGVFNFLNNAVEIVGVYVPGGDPYETKSGQARLIKAGSDLVFQMHYTANGKETPDRSKVGIVFAKEPPKERVVNTFIMNPNLRIPPGAPDHEIQANVTVHADVTVNSLFPHMHVRGKGFEYRAHYPTGESELLLSVPKYDFNWQTTYYFTNPVRMPKGTRIQAIARYDNSPNNPHNPDPKAEVTWGDQTWEEMLAGFVDFVIPVDMPVSDIARPRPPATTAAAGQ